MASIRDVGARHCIIHSARQILNDRLRPLGLTSAEGNILLHLLTRPRSLRQEGNQRGARGSARRRCQGPGFLESKGLIVREKDESDRRASLVCLTARARSMAGQHRGHLQRPLRHSSPGLNLRTLKPRCSSLPSLPRTLPGPEPGGRRGKMIDDIIGAAILMAYYLVILVALPTALRAWTRTPKEVVRKFQHVGYSMSVFILVRLFAKSGTWPSPPHSFWYCWLIPSSSCWNGHPSTRRGLSTAPPGAANCASSSSWSSFPFRSSSLCSGGWWAAGGITSSRWR